MAQLEAEDAVRHLLERGISSPFFELVSALERLFPERPALGTTGPYSEEAVHFAQDTKLAFPSSDLSSVSRSPDGRHVEIVTTFMGLIGSATPLPLYLAEEIAQADLDDSNEASFLNLFHHRLMSLLYRAVADLSYPHAYRRLGADPVSESVVALTGMLSGPADPDQERRRLHLRYAGLLLSHPGSSEALEVALEDALQPELGDGKVRLVCFIGGRVELAEDARSRLGQNTRLARDFLIGSRVRDRASKVRICVGPLSGEGYQSLLPGKPAFERARKLLEVMLREPLDYELELELHAQCGFDFQLGRDQLGEMTWLGQPRGGTRVRIPGRRRRLSRAAEAQT